MDKYTININNEYRNKIKDGEYILFAESDGNFNYYINNNRTVYAIAKDDSCCSSFFGALSYFFKIYIYYSSDDISLTKQAYDLLIKEIESSYYYKCIKEDILSKVKLI